MPIGEIKKGAVADAVAANVKTVRERRRLQQQQLSARLAELGRPIPPTALSKLEDGRRRVDVDDLVALAVALNVSPTRLLLPDAYDRRTQVQLTDEVQVPSDRAWRWAEGRGALAPNARDMSEDEMTAEVMAYRQERPTRLRAAEEHPAVRAVAGLALAVEYAVLASREATEGAAPGWEQALAQARIDLERVRAELDIFAREASGRPSEFTVVDAANEEEEDSRG